MNGQLAFSVELARNIIAAGITLAELRRRLAARRYSISLNHISCLTRSKRRPSPRFINAAGRALELNKNQIQRMHRAAALDRGFAIGGL